MRKLRPRKVSVTEQQNQDHKCKLSLIEQLHTLGISFTVRLTHIERYMYKVLVAKTGNNQRVCFRNWLNKLWYAHTVEFCAAAKRKEDFLCEVMKDFQDTSLK